MACSPVVYASGIDNVPLPNNAILTTRVHMQAMYHTLYSYLFRLPCLARVPLVVQCTGDGINAGDRGAKRSMLPSRTPFCWSSVRGTSDCSYFPSLVSPWPLSSLEAGSCGHSSSLSLPIYLSHAHLPKKTRLDCWKRVLRACTPAARYSTRGGTRPRRSKIGQDRSVVGPRIRLPTG